jgi:hypothetical protein
VLDLWLWLGKSYSVSTANGTLRVASLTLGLPLGPTLLGAALALLIVGREMGK